MTRARLRKSGSTARSSVRTRVADLRAMLLSVAKRIVGVKAAGASRRGATPAEAQLTLGPSVLIVTRNMATAHKTTKVAAAARAVAR
jgi:hypothetical protein